MKCPKCGYDQPDGKPDCLACGIFFDKWKAMNQEELKGASSTSQSDIKTSSRKPEPPPLLEAHSSSAKPWIISIAIIGILGLIGYALGRPECFTLAILFGGVDLLMMLGKDSLPDSLIRGYRIHGRAFATFAMIILIFQYPYIITPNFLVKERSLDQVAAHLQKFRNQKVKVRGVISSLEGSSFNIGADEMVHTHLILKNQGLSGLINFSGLERVPQLDDYVVATGAVRRYGGSNLQFIANDIVYLDEDPPSTPPEDIQSLQEALQNPSAATELTIQDVFLNEIPSELSQLTHLKTLVLENCRLRKLGSQIGQLTSLENLQLQDNKLSSLPQDISSLVNLTSLTLRSNNFSEIPEVVSELSQLESLDMSHNPLISIGPKIGRLVSLTYLNLQYTQLEEMDDAITNLNRLKTLNLMNNKLTSLPLELKDRDLNLLLRANPVESQFKKEKNNYRSITRHR